MSKSNSNRNVINKKDKSPNKGKNRIEQFKNVCKKIITFLFSTVGLLLLLFSYIIIGINY